jgi:hypothetical protein
VIDCASAKRPGEALGAFNAAPRYPPNHARANHCTRGAYDRSGAIGRGYNLPR